MANVIDIDKAKADSHLLDAWKQIEGAAQSRELDKLLGQAKRVQSLLGAKPVDITDEVKRAKDIFAPLPEVPWVIEGLGLSPGAPAMIAGAGYTAKTMSAQALLLAVAAGHKVWGRFECERGSVLHIDYEQGDYLTRWRYQRLLRAMRIEPEDVDLHLLCMPRLQLDADGAEDKLVELATGRKMCLIDSFRAACPKTDENSSDARMPLDMLHRVSQRTGCVFIVIHHARKAQQGTGEDDPTSAIRGSGAIFDACASVFFFRGGKNKPTFVHHQKQRVTGQTSEDFVLEREDVADPDKPTHGWWGLRVAASSADSAREQAREEDQRELFDKVFAFIRKTPGCSKTEIREAISARTQAITAVCDKLERDGKITNHGKGRKQAWSATAT